MTSLSVCVKKQVSASTATLEREREREREREKEKERERERERVVYNELLQRKKETTGLKVIHVDVDLRKVTCITF